MKPPSGSDTRQRLLFHLKTRGPQTAEDLARRLGVTAVAVRQQGQRLLDEGLVRVSDEQRGRGRPTRLFRLSEAGDARFPQGYADLTLDLLGELREEFGAEGLARLVRRRTEQQRRTYAAAVPADEPLRRRVAALCRLRAREGYMSEWSAARDGTFTLVENHCPICAAASVCQGLCEGELELFRDTLGPDAHVERTEHILEGARRCAYRIRPVTR